MKKMTLCDNGLSIRTLRFLVVLSAWFAVTLCNAQDNAILKTAKGSAITKKHAVRDAGTKLAMTKLFASPQFYGIKNATPVPDGMARIVLEAGDLWGDGSGYQFLMGKNLYGSVIPERGALTQGCPAPDGLYDYFEYKIPVNADGSCETTNVVMNNSLSIDVPADVYDYCVVNPTPGDKIWIAGNGRVWDMEFKPGVTYYFTVVRQGSGDAVSLECIYAADDLPPYLRYCTDDITDGVGTDSENTFSAAVTFSPTALAAYEGSKIKAIQVGIAHSFVYELSDMSVWIRNTLTGEDLVHKAASFAPGWTTVELDEDFVISGTDPLAIGYTLTTTGGYPLGMSANLPNVIDGGHLNIGGQWSSLGAAQISGNNAISALVEVKVEPTDLPGGIVNMSVLPAANGALNATVSFTTPSVTASGHELTSLSKVDIYRGDEFVYSFDSPEVGSALSYTDHVNAGALYTYSVSAWNSTGEGPASTATAYIGTDLPVAPTNVTAVWNGSAAVITWDAPDAGVHGGWINPENLTYKVVRITDDMILAANHNSCSFEDTTIPVAGKYQYRISAVNSAGESMGTTSDVAVLGNFDIQVPYAMNFEDDEMYELWTIIDDNEDDKTWSRDASSKSMRYTYHSTNAANDYLISPKIPLMSGKSYQVSFNTRAMSSTFAERMELHLGRDQSKESICRELWQEDVNYTSNKNVLLDVEVQESGDYTFLFKATSDPDKFYLYLDDFSIKLLTPVQGIVTDGVNPVEGALISVEGTEVSAYTNADGSYYLPLTPGSYVLNITKKGYEDASFEVVPDADGENIHNFTIEAFPLVHISGKIMGFDTQAGLEGVAVKLTGYENYETATAEDGVFTIADVYAKNSYKLTVTTSGYSSYVDELFIENSVDNIEITLNEIAFPVMNVNVEVISGIANVSWDAPMQGEVKQYILDDGSAENGFAINPYYSASYGNKFSTGDAGVITDIDIFGMMNPSAHGERMVKMVIYDMNKQYVGESAEFVIPGDEWINVELPFIPYDGEFYAMVNFSDGEDRSNFIGFDMNGENAVLGLNYIIYEDGSWDYATNIPGVFMIRANAIATGTSTKQALAPAQDYAKRSRMNVASVSELAFSDASGARSIVAGKPAHSEWIAKAIGVLHYNVYRKAAMEDESGWTKLNTAAITGLSYQDTSSDSATPGFYHYGVEAVYTGDNASTIVSSPEVALGLTYTIVVNDAEGGSVTGAGVYKHGDTAVLTATADEFYYFKGWSDGVTDNPRTIVVSEDMTLTPLFVKYSAPQNLVIGEAGSPDQRLLSWDMGSVAYEDDIEGHTTFTINSPGEIGWSYIDGDDSETYGFDSANFENNGQPMAFIVFNQEETTPAVSNLDAHSGSKFLASFASVNGANNDWIISPELSFDENFTFSFWAKSYTDDYGLERMKVRYSTKEKEQNDFTGFLAGSEDEYVQVPANNWCHYSFTVPSDATYVAIQCVSYDSFIFMLDDISIIPGVSTMAIMKPEGYNVFLNSAHHATTYAQEFLLSNLPAGQTHTAGVQAVYENGVSEIISDSFITDATGIEGFTSESLRIYTEAMHIVIQNSGEQVPVTVYDTNGCIIAVKEASAATEIRISVTVPGVYFVTIGDAKYKVAVH